MLFQGKVIKDTWLPACYLLSCFLDHSPWRNQLPCHEQPHGEAHVAGLSSSHPWMKLKVGSLACQAFRWLQLGLISDWKTLSQNHSSASRFSEIRNSWYSSMTYRNCEIMCVALSCQFLGWFVNIQLQIVYNVNTFSLCCQNVISSEILSLMVLSKGGAPPSWKITFSLIYFSFLHSPYYYMVVQNSPFPLLAYNSTHLDMSL